MTVQLLQCENSDSWLEGRFLENFHDLEFYWGKQPQIQTCSQQGLVQ